MTAVVVSSPSSALGSFLAELIRSNDAFMLTDSSDDGSVKSIELLVDNPVSRSPLSPRSRRRRVRGARGAAGGGGCSGGGEEPSRGVCRWNSSEEFHLCQTCSSRRCCRCQNNPFMNNDRSRLLPHVPTRRTSLSPMGKNKNETKEEEEQQQQQEAVAPQEFMSAPPRMPRRSSDTSCTSSSSSSTFATTAPMSCASPTKMDRLSTCSLSNSSSSSSSFASPVAPLTLNELLSYGKTQTSHHHHYAVTMARPILTFPKTPALHRATTVRTAAVNALDASLQRPAAHNETL